MIDTCIKPATLLNLPTDIRTYLYDAFFPFGFIIYINLEIATSIGPWTSFFRTCRQIHTEVTEYLSLKPITLLCTAGQRPNVLHAIPRTILPKVEVVVIEDSPGPHLALGLVPNLKCICFCEVWRSTYSVSARVLRDKSADEIKDISTVTTSSSQLQARGHVPTPHDHSLASSLANLHTSPIAPISKRPKKAEPSGIRGPSRSLILPLSSNNDVLRLAHQSWKNLRLDHAWVREIWKEHPGIRFILRRVDEMQINILADITQSENVVYVSHSVVDVSTKSIIEKRYLPTRPALDISDDNVMFEYGAQNWWKLDSGWRRSEKPDA